MINLNKEQIRSILPSFSGYIAQELEYAHRGEDPVWTGELYSLRKSNM